MLAIGLIAGGAAAAEVPHGIAGFVLDRPIEEVADLVLMDTRLPVRYMENFHEVEIKPVEGIKSGLIAFATCLKPSRVVRIKLKYADGSIAYYEDLLKRLKKRYGEPAEYKGDPFKNLIIWKWSFTDAERNRISMTLQHNALDEDEKLGNAIKLSLINRVEEDLRCARENMGDTLEKLRLRRWEERKAQGDRWDFLLPR
jgi:hypothetical protein